MLELDGERIEHVSLETCTPGQVRIAVDGVTRTYRVHAADHSVYVDSSLGASTLREIERFPLPEDQVEAGSLVAPLPGVVNEVKVAAGDKVEAGDSLIVIESMKMLHHVEAPAAGAVTDVRVATGDTWSRAPCSS